ncbi:Thioesterase/thiol ester dehydrase-isomerase [Panus rudis PR-1116 ss-1]|nr:Thioesterase/thiol ester dehydrase-isomerase [Panus rudis PR-1116 ss-1]
MAELPSNQVEAKDISTAVEVEQLDANLFRSRSLWIPFRARGVFGGQVISQALVSATRTVDTAFGLHSMHCYFLLSASPAIPILYHVDKLRDGRSYSTRSVRAVQNGSTVFMMLCSFHKPEVGQPSHQWPMLSNVPHPDACEKLHARAERSIQQSDVDPSLRAYLSGYIREREQSPFEVKDAGVQVSESGVKTYMYWYKLKNLPKFDASFQKCILSYISDSHFIGAAARTISVDRWKKPPKRLGMMSTLDHSIYFYDDSFDCGDWLLYAISSPRIGSGRAVVHGRMYTLDGKLVAVMSQEGVLRVDNEGRKAKL